MKVNLISKRAQYYLTHPAAYNKELDDKFSVTLNEWDKVHTVFHSEQLGTIEFIMAEVLAKFAATKNLSELWKINFREIENFLRDENHLPAISEDQTEVTEIFLKTKILLMAGMIKALLKTDFDNLYSTVLHWEKLTLVEKNKWSQSFFKPLGWELVLSEDDLVYVKISQEVSEVERPLVIDLLLKSVFTSPSNQAFRGEEWSLPMKLVAV